MLGHYYYYIDTPDDGHECMWSGDCCLISPSLIKQAAPDEATSGKSLLAICGTAALCGGGRPIQAICDGHQQVTSPSCVGGHHHHQLAVVAAPAIGYQQQVPCSPSDNLQLAAVALPTTAPTPTFNTTSSTIITTTATTPTTTTVSANTRQGSKKSSSRQQQQHQHQSQSNNSERNEASRGLQVANKKLRHREVEKNRHRQLQAMVKNISERIPGRLDKETQVQTMKRAARYCLYLRDIMNLLNHGQAQLQLQKMYLKAWDSVELMSQC